jgi:hypothetical protein
MPILDHKSDDYNLMLTNENIFKNYYDGLISYFSVSYNDSSYPKRNFIVELLESNDVKNLSSDKKIRFSF